MADTPGANAPGAEDADDTAVEHAHDGPTFDADEGDPDGAAFAGAQSGSEPDSDESGSADQPREHGYGYE